MTDNAERSFMRVIEVAGRVMAASDWCDEIVEECLNEETERGDFFLTRLESAGLWDGKTAISYRDATPDEDAKFADYCDDEDPALIGPDGNKFPGILA